MNRYALKKPFDVISLLLLSVIVPDTTVASFSTIIPDPVTREGRDDGHLASYPNKSQSEQ